MRLAELVGDGWRQLAVRAAARAGGERCGESALDDLRALGEVASSLPIAAACRARHAGRDHPSCGYIPGTRPVAPTGMRDAVKSPRIERPCRPAQARLDGAHVLRTPSLRRRLPPPPRSRGRCLLLPNCPGLQRRQQRRRVEPRGRRPRVPAGVASGDPRPDSIVLWTRIENDGRVRVASRVAFDEADSQVDRRGRGRDRTDRDGTVKIKPVGSIRSRPTGTAYRLTSMTGARRPRRRPATWRFAFDVLPGLRRPHTPGRWRAFPRRVARSTSCTFGDWLPTRPPAIPTSRRRRESRGPARQTAARRVDDIQPRGADSPTTGRSTRPTEPTSGSSSRTSAFPVRRVVGRSRFANDCWQDHATDFNEARGDEVHRTPRGPTRRSSVPADRRAVRRNAGFPTSASADRCAAGATSTLMLIDGRLSTRSDHVIPEGPVDLSVGKFSANNHGSRATSCFPPASAAARGGGSADAARRRAEAWLLSSLRGVAGDLEDPRRRRAAVADGDRPARLRRKLPEQFRNLFLLQRRPVGRLPQRARAAARSAASAAWSRSPGDITPSTRPGSTGTSTTRAPLVAVEFVCAGISSSPVQRSRQSTVDSRPTLSALGLGALVPQFDAILQQGEPAVPLREESRTASRSCGRAAPARSRSSTCRSPTCARPSGRRRSSASLRTSRARPDRAAGQASSGRTRPRRATASVCTSAGSSATNADGHRRRRGSGSRARAAHCRRCSVHGGVQ